MSIVAYAKEHPYQIGGIAVVGVLVLYLVASSGNGSNQGSTSAQDAQLQQEALQLSAQSTQQQNAINGTIALAQQNGANDLAIATLQSHTQGDTIAAQLQYSTTHDILAQQLGIATINGQLSIAQIQADVQNNTINTQGAVQLSGIEANKYLAGLNYLSSVTNTATIADEQRQIALYTNQTQQYVAGVTAQTQRQISDNQSRVSIRQSEVAGEIAKAASSNNLFGQIIGVVGGIAGALI